MHLSDKEFTTKLKLYFSTLFARSMPKIIIGCPGLSNNVFLFTNIKLEEIEFYEPDSAYFLHEVEINDSEFLEDLFEQFDLFKKATCILYADKFLATYSKHQGPISEIKLSLKDKELFISVITEDNQPLSVECGELISEYIASQYKKVFDSVKIDPIVAKEFDIKKAINPTQPYTVIDIPFFENRICKAALVLNQSGVSIKEFPSKAKINEYVYSAIAKNDGNTIILNTKFSCPQVTVTSVQPHMIWFTKTNIQNKEVKNA